MKKIICAAVIVSLFIFSCKSKEGTKETNAVKTETTEQANNAGRNTTLDLDVATLKDEAAFLKAWEDYTYARMDDQKKHEADKNHDDHYVEYLKMYTTLLKATTEFSKTITPAAASVAFQEKVSAIQNKMYTATK